MFKKLLITLLLTFFSTQASAFVSKGFVPANVSKINVGMNDNAMVVVGLILVKLRDILRIN
jgi:hypothetical protein